MFRRVQLKIYLHIRHKLIQDLPGRPRRGAVLLYNAMKKLSICYRLQDPDMRRLLISSETGF